MKRFTLLVFGLLALVAFAQEPMVAFRTLKGSSMICVTNYGPYIVSSFGALTAHTNEWNAAVSWGDHALAGYLTVEADTLQSVTTRGGFAGTETITPLRVGSAMFGPSSGDHASGVNWGAYGKSAGGGASGDTWGAYGYYAGWLATGNGWGAYGYYAGNGASGTGWGAYGYQAGTGASGTGWGAYGVGSGTGASGTGWGAYGYQAGLSAIWTNSHAFGSYAGYQATGNTRLYIDVYSGAPASSNGVGDMIFGDNGQLNLGRIGTLTNPLPNQLRGRWIGNASEFTGITAAQVEGALTNSGPATLSSLRLTGPVVSGASVGTSTDYIAATARGASQWGIDGFGGATIGAYAVGAQQRGFCVSGPAGPWYIGPNAYGATQVGFSDEMNAGFVSVTNLASGAFQLFDFSEFDVHQHALTTAGGGGSLMLGGSVTSNRHALVVGSGTSSHGDGSITAAGGFWGDGSQLTGITAAHETVVPITSNADYTVAAGQKACVFYYTGTGPLRFTLPAVVVGSRYGIVNATTNTIEVWPAGAGVKIDACGVGAPLWNSGRDYINKEPFSSVSLLAVSSTWWFIPVQGRGEWTQTEL